MSGSDVWGAAQQQRGGLVKALQQCWACGAQSCLRSNQCHTSVQLSTEGTDFKTRSQTVNYIFSNNPNNGLWGQSNPVMLSGCHLYVCLPHPPGPCRRIGLGKWLSQVADSNCLSFVRLSSSHLTPFRGINLQCKLGIQQWLWPLG